MNARYFLAFLLLVLWTAPAARAQSFFTGTLTAAQEPGGVDSEATGTAAVALTDEGVRFVVSVDGLTGPITAAHFHRGVAGVNGPPVRTITGDFTGNTASGLWTATDSEPLTDELIAALFSGELYLNVHTAQNQPGEIRAQLYPTSGAGLAAHLTPDQEPGGVESDGSGTAAVQATDAGVLFFVTVDGLTGPITAAHFHAGAAGVNGPPVRTITDDFTGNTAFGLWTAADGEPFTAEQLQALMTGDLYLNVHTAQNQPGEVRGQVVPAEGWGLSARLDAEQEPGGVDSDATGTATMTLTDAGLVFHVTVDGLTGPITAAHFHTGAPGVNGPPVRTITGDFTGNTASGLWTADDDEPLTDELLRALLAGELYLNVHTEQHQPGEIRGQVLLDEGTSLSAYLTPDQEPGGVDSDAQGTATMTLTDEGVAFAVTVQGLTGPITAAHFHRGAVGINGPPVRTITGDFTGNTASGVWTAADGEPFTDELLRALLAGELYLNVHTEQHQPGEIRGQVYPSSGTALRAVLTPDQEPGGVDSDGAGTAAMTLTDAGLVFRVTASGLTGPITAAHFHTGAAGVNGPPVRTITDDFTGNTASGVWTATDGEPFTDEMLRALLAGTLYLNLHTAQNQPGEIRGQVVPSGGIGAAVHLTPDQEPGGVESDGQGTAALTLTPAGVVFALTAEGLTGPVTAAHFHTGAPGENGPPVRTITDDFTGNTASGLWTAADGEPLTAEVLDDLLGGTLYLNVHTAQHQGGEIRGQINPGRVVVTAVEPVDGELPAAFALAQNYPNPFNPTTTIAFALTRSTHAVLRVYDVLGRRVATLVDQRLPAGTYTVAFTADELPSGVYHYRLDADGLTQARTMLLVK